MSEATRIRLQSYKKKFVMNEMVQETWTFYPDNVATTIIGHYSGLKFQGKIMMLSQATLLSQDCVKADTTRTIEAFRHTNALIRFAK